ncbi:MAG: efflux RND transporter periplasmic adaptor subunit [Methyloligellaceae bacterium]
MATRRKTQRPRRSPGNAARKESAAPRPPRRAWRFLTLSAKVLLPVVVLLLAVASYAGLKATRPEVPQRPVREPVWPVQTMPAQVSDHQPTIRLYGRTLAGRSVDLRALVSGEVIEKGPNLQAGSQVARDEVLLKIDPFQYRGALLEAEAALAEARARQREIEAEIESERDAILRAREQLRIARRDLERALPLAERGAVSRKLVDDRRLAVSEREQALEARTNNMAVLNARLEQQTATIAKLAWKVRLAKRNLEDTVLKAPFDAYVSVVNADVGRLVSVNDSVATLLDRNWIEVRFTLSNAQYGRIMAAGDSVTGREVEVRWQLGERTVKYRARVERVAAEINAESGGVDIYARILDPGAPIAIRPGAFVEVLLTDRRYSDVVRLPHTALYNGDTVFAVKDGTLVPRKVDLVGAVGTDILVRGAISPGEPIMITRLSKAEAGLRVREQ